MLYFLIEVVVQYALALEVRGLHVRPGNKFAHTIIVGEKANA